MDIIEFDEYIGTLTRHQLKIMESLYYANGDWCTRAQMAKALKKKRLTPYDIECIKGMVRKGLILESKRPTHAPGSDFAYIYSMSDNVAEFIQEWAKYREQKPVKKRKPIKFY